MIKDYQKTAIISGDRIISYTEMLQRIQLFSLVTPHEKGKMTLIIGENREGWIYAFFAVWHNQGIPVPVDASSTQSDILYIINDCSPSAIWVTPSKYDTVRAAVLESGKAIKILIIDEFEKVEAIEEEIKPYTWADGDDTAIIIYTSGTTGSPKGVMLTYNNLFANMYGVSEEVKIFNTERRTMILLPLHHVLPLMGTMIVPILQGGGVAICPTMSGPDIMDTLCRGKVAIFVGVPRLWQTLYHGIKKKIDASFVTRMLFALCKKANSRRLSRIVFSSIRKKMGGKIEYCVSGGAALDREIGEGLRTLGLDVLEGYGMTETAPIIAFTRPDDIIPGCCGLPLPSVECKIINGEICCKGPNVMKGYYNRPEETRQVIDEDGFLHTGDLARFDEKGRVYITGRTKEIIVLSNGKNVQPSEIEYKLETYSEIVKEAAVVQDGDMLRAIIVPQESYAAGKDDKELSLSVKREVLEKYNLTVMNYKKVMSVFIYRGDLPRTKLDKLQRYKLKDILAGGVKEEDSAEVCDDSNTSKEYLILKNYIEQEKGIKVTPLSHFETDLTFDSLDMVSLQGFVENTFGMRLQTAVLTRCANVGELAEVISSKMTRIDVEETDWKTILSADSNSVLPTSSWTYPFISRLLKCFMTHHNSLKILGAENIPSEGPYIIAPNHQSVLDGPLTLCGVRKEDISRCYFYATEDHVKGVVAKAFAKRHNIILMERKTLKTSILKLADVLKQGKVVVIYPEGSRTKNGKVAPFKKTFAILAKELNVPVIPVTIRGAYESLPRGSRIPNSHPITIEYHKPVIPSQKMSYEEFSDTVRNEIVSNM